MIRRVKILLGVSVAALVSVATAAQEVKPLPSPDERYKADVLLVVAHPDDEAGGTMYLAKALDEGKRVAVVFCTRGGSGSNQAGPEQAAALADERELEARRALSVVGVTNVWFIGGKDTASQNVLESLASWGHGARLEEFVRLVRLTRAEVILTMMPGTFLGEDHGDHQACGVLATEAFDLAGDPTVFPEQVAAPNRRLEPYLENLRAWQPKKLYFFPDGEDDAMFRGKGPEYSVTGLSRTAKKAYWRLAIESFSAHQTQAKSYLDALAKLDEAQLEKRAKSEGWSDPQRFVLGKSLVGGSVTGDIFEGIKPGAIPYVRPDYVSASAEPDVAVELAGPWSYYEEFRREHGLMNLWHPDPPEIALQAGTTLVIPLWLRNQTSATKEFSLSIDVPAGWKVQSGTGKYEVPADYTAAARYEVNLPEISPGDQGKQELQDVTVHAESGGRPVGTVRLRVKLRTRALPE
jgi:LmbE family N-acetylglucosaminyl deacetylase